MDQTPTRFRRVNSTRTPLAPQFERCGMNCNWIMAVAISILLGACATPHVVQTTRMGDQHLTCNQLDLEMSEADRFRAEAQKEKAVTGTNVAAAIFFWPAIIGTYSNSNEAIAAADTRKTHLMSLYIQKNCSNQGSSGSRSTKDTEKRLENLKTMLQKGLISSGEYEERRKSILNSL